MAPLTIATEQARVVLRPDLGGALARYDLTDGRAVMLGADPEGADLGRAGCFPMVPWCNRLSDGVTVDGEKLLLAPNLDGQSCPIHGSGFQQAWTVAVSAPDRARLELTCALPAPFDYAAALDYRLEGASLTIALSVTHRGTTPMPYGLGLHPWWPRTSATQLGARIDTVTETDARQLPVRDVPIAQHPEWDFRMPKALPDGLVDHCFGGWDGRMEMLWPDRGLAVTMETDPACRWLQVYSPGREADFFACEPVTHPVDAPNLPGYPGLWTLSRGETATLTTRFLPRDI